MLVFALPYNARLRKEVSRAKTAANIVYDMSNAGSIAVVEGKLDVEAAKAFSIRSITFERLRADGSELNNYSKVFIFMDIDDSGLRKAEQALRIIDEKEISAKIDSTSGPRLLKTVGAKCVEAMVKPLQSLLRE